MSYRSVRHNLVFVAIVMATVCLSGMASATEPIRPFLAALVNRGYYDMGLDYLQWLETTGLADSDFQQTMGYERAQILLTSASSQQDPKIREEDLGRAQQHFEAFLAKYPTHPRAVDAQRGLRQIQVDLARSLARRAEQPNADRDKLYAQARTYFDQAAASYQQRAEETRGQLETLRQGGSPATNRDELRAEYLQAKLMSATVAYEIAATTKSNPSEYKQRLDAADEQFAELAKKYRTWLTGILAVYYRGQIQQDLGNLKDALVYYEEHITEMNQPDAFRNVAAKATANAIQCWIDPSLKQFDQAINVGEKWIAAARPADNDRPEWLALRMMVARAYRAKADATTGDASASLRTNARKTAQFVARFAGPAQAEARKFLAELGGPTAADTDLDETNTFAAARTAAIQARQEIANSDTLIKLQSSKLASINSADGRREAELQLAETQKLRDQQVQKALQLHQLALRLTDADTPVEQINDLRYYDCYLLYTSGRYYEAAVLGDFIARNYPDAPGARTAANIALASYATIQNETTQDKAHDDRTAKSGSSDFVSLRLAGLADHIVRTWPGQKEADDALMMLVSLMVRDGRLDQAEQYLTKIPADSPRRGDAEIRAGQALWSHYARAAADNPEMADDQLKQRAKKLLQDGIARLKQSPPDAALVRAVLSLSQVYLDTSDPQSAIELLEDKQIGPKTLADRRSPLIVNTPGLPELVYRVALRGYIGSSSLAKVSETMESLSKTVDDSPDGRRRLVAIYMGLATDLQTQIEMAPAQQRKALSASFDKFLANVSSNTQDFNILNWVAATYSDIGDGFDSGAATLSPDAKRFYEKSAAEYARILQLTQQGALQLDKNVVATLRMRLASEQRRLGDYEQAVATLADILGENNMMLNVQIEAARALQAGATAGKTDWYARAVMGDARAGDQKPVIWGWGKISKIVAAQMYKSPEAKQKYGDAFYDARLQMAQCQYEQAARAKGDRRAAYLANAKKILTSTASLYPDLGGAKWKTKYEKLLSDIHQALGEPASGFDATK